jgi:hypothetical protein
MPIKGSIATDHLLSNEYVFEVTGLPVQLTIQKIGELEQELEKVTLSDRRVVTGGSTKALETEVETPTHHFAEQAVWEQWHVDSKFPAKPNYKKTVTLSMLSSTGLQIKSWILTGVFPFKRKTSELEMASEGKDVRTTWMISIDEVIPQ